MAGLIKTLSGSLATALGLAALPVHERETRIPSLGAVRLAADGDGLSITSTSFDGAITTSLEAEAEGEMAVPQERLADLVRNFPAEAELAIATADNAAMVTCGKARFRLPVFPIADLPEPLALGEETGFVELEARIARDLLLRPAFAAATEISRYYFNGIFLHNVGDDLVAVAADGSRLCRVTTPATTPLSIDRSLIIPNEMAKTISRLLGTATGNVTLRRSERLFSVEGTDFALVSKRIDATYPQYERLILPDPPNVVTTSRAKLREALARFAAVADPRARAPFVCLRWDADGLHLGAPDGSADSLAADVEGEAGTAVQIHYLAEILGALRGDSVRICTADPGSPALITDPENGNFLALVTPIRTTLS